MEKLLFAVVLCGIFCSSCAWLSDKTINDRSLRLYIAEDSVEVRPGDTITLTVGAWNQGDAPIIVSLTGCAMSLRRVIPQFGFTDIGWEGVCDSASKVTLSQLPPKDTMLASIRFVSGGSVRVGRPMTFGVTYVLVDATGPRNVRYVCGSDNSVVVIMKPETE